MLIISRRLGHRISTTVLALATFCSAQGVQISGHVVRLGGEGLADVTVRLAGQRLSAITDSLGFFQIVRPAAVRTLLGRNMSAVPAIVGNTLRFSVPANNTRVRVAVRDLAGRTIGIPLAGRYEAGTRSVPLNSGLDGDGMRVVEVRIGPATYVLPFGIAGTARTGIPGYLGTSQTSELSKTSAAALDTLLISHPGYTTCRWPIESYVDTVSIHLDTASGAAITGLNAAYDETAQVVHLSWTPPVEPITSYRVYRTSTTDESGEPIRWTSTGAQVFVPAGSASFDDIPGPALGVHFYRLQAVKADGVTEGALSEVVTVEIGLSLSFSINHGNPYVANDTTTVTLIDRNRIYESIRLTDSVQVDAAGKVFPVFDGPFARNTGVSFALSAVSSSYPWILPKGAGQKTVFAEITRSDTTRDTLRDAVAIQPYSIRVVPEVDPATSVRVKKGSYVGTNYASVDIVTISKPNLVFSVVTGGDTTFAATFRYWIVTGSSTATLKSYSNDYLLETVPETGTLAAGDAPGIIYDFNPATVAGARHLSALTVTSGLRTVAEGEVCTEATFGNTVLDTIVPGDPRQGLELLLQLVGTQKKSGAKEIVIVVECRGKYFDEPRRYVTSANLSSAGEYVLRYDNLPPMVVLDKFEFWYPYSGDTLVEPFNVIVTPLPADNSLFSYRGSVVDNGGAAVLGVDLFFSRVVEGTPLAHRLDTLAARDIAEQVTIEDILALPHHVYPFQLGPPLMQVAPVAWMDIDPTQWISGRYLMAIVTRDSFGNVGIAPFNQNTGSTPVRYQYNSQIVTVLTGNHEL